MKNMMSYKNYFGTVEYSDEDQIFYGRIAFIRDLISYEGESVKTLKENFQEAVDEYLSEFEKPNVPFKGSLNIRIGEDLHRKLASLAAAKDESINKTICSALDGYVKKHQKMRDINKIA